MTNYLMGLLISIPGLILALSLHEFAHGYAAYLMGDNTAKYQGRLSLNPFHHLDPIGTLCLFLFHFGWARPVPINSRYFKKPRRDMALTAAAGPVSNFIMAFIGLLLRQIFLAVFSAFPAQSSFAWNIQYALLMLLSYFHSLNLSLGVFNLIPIPPLDGSRIFLTFLPAKYYFGIMKYERYIQLALMLALWTGILTLPLSTFVGWISSGMMWIVSLLPFQ